jgi:curved DNA-binding protein CbpA
MFKNDAVKVLNLTGEINQAAIKKAYQAACSKFHPDRNPAGLEMMKLINQAYEVLKNEQDFTTTNETNYDEKLSDAINAAMRMDGVNIEICGLWVWLSGDTRPHKEAIKEAGYFWASKKRMWYFRPADYKSSSRGKLNMDEIREKHGSKFIKKEESKKLK